MIELMCGPDNDVRLLSISIPENTETSNVILVGFTGGIDSSFLLYLVAKLNSVQKIPFIIQPITIGILERIEYIPKIIEFIKLETNQLINNTILIDVDNTLPINRQIKNMYYQYFNSSKNHKLFFLGDTEHPPNLRADYIRNFPKYKKLNQPFKNLNKSHVIDAMIKLNLEELINMSPRCPRYHKYANSPCTNFFCKERRWAYSLLKRPDLLEKFISKDT
jgi:hypothetical protein